MAVKLLFEDDAKRPFRSVTPARQPPPAKPHEIPRDDPRPKILNQSIGAGCMIPSIIIVGADKGGVGKTTITRALLDYLAERNIRIRTFDAECPAGDLKRFASDAEVVDISRVQDQMKVFDGIGSDAVTVLDLRGGLLSSTLQALEDGKLLDEIKANKMQLILLHVLGPTMSSIAEVAQAAKRIGGGAAHHFIVKNHINQTQYFEWDQGAPRAEWQQMANVTIDVPQLSEIACETLQKLGGSFATFCGDKHPAGPQSRMLRGGVKTWLETVWKEFDRVGINKLITA
jgi:hypothetical protein